MKFWRRLDVRLFASYALVALVVFAALAEAAGLGVAVATGVPAAMPAAAARASVFHDAGMGAYPSGS